jgi:hypothetical protein
MLYLHCGWAKTGTTTLQAGLVEHRERLAAAGIVYPQKWTKPGDDSHKLFAAGDDPDAAIAAVAAFLREHAGGDVLISSEVLSLRLYRGALHEPLLRLIAAARETMPVRCIWTVRRFDDAVHSICVQRAIAGLQWGPDCVARVDPDDLFAGMRAADEAADEAVYVAYGGGGDYQAELLGAMGVPAAAAEAVYASVTARPRLNTSQSHKELAALLNLDSLSRRCGTALDGRQVREALAGGELRFDGDRRADLFEAAMRRELQEKALAAARRHAVSAYVRCFEEISVEPSPPPLSSDPSALSDRDLERLTA